MINFIKKITCRHTWELIYSLSSERIFYDDEETLLNFSKCTKCGSYLEVIKVLDFDGYEDLYRTHYDNKRYLEIFIDELIY